MSADTSGDETLSWVPECFTFSRLRTVTGSDVTASLCSFSASHWSILWILASHWSTPCVVTTLWLDLTPWTAIMEIESWIRAWKRLKIISDESRGRWNWQYNNKNTFVLFWISLFLLFTWKKRKAQFPQMVALMLMTRVSRELGLCRVLQRYQVTSPWPLVPDEPTSSK